MTYRDATRAEKQALDIQHRCTAEMVIMLLNSLVLLLLHAKRTLDANP